MTAPFDVDPDPALARTPPAELYTDPALRRRIRAEVLVRSWQQLWPADDPGDATVVPVGLAGEPALWVADERGERLLSNVCTHRAAILVDAPCRASVVRCPYHGRRFRLDGTVSAAPGFDGDLSAADALRTGEVRSVGPIRFGAMSPQVPFDAWWAPVAARLDHLGFPWRALRRDPGGDRAHAIPAPWLLYVENYLEGFHVPFVHPELSKTLEVGRYGHELLPHGTLQIGVAKPGQPAFEPTAGPEAGLRVAAYWFWLWPTTLVNVYPWGVSLNLLEDTSDDGCVVRYRAWVLDESLRGAGAGGALDLVEEQDQSVVLRAWSGVRSSLFRRGRYAPAHERGVHHFHRLLAAALAGPRDPSSGPAIDGLP